MSGFVRYCPKTPFVFLLIANGVNVALDFLFVAVFRWGVAGVALTTVFSQLLSAALMLSALTRTKLPCKISLNRLRIRRQSLAPILKKGLPIAVQSTLYPLANMLVQSRINPFGTDSIAAWAVCGRLDFLVWLIADAFCDAAATFVAQNYGARRYDRGRRGVKTALLMSIGVIGLLSVGLYLWNVPLAHIFVQDAGVIAISAEGRKKSCIIKLEEIGKISAVHRKENEDHAHLMKTPLFLPFCTGCCQGTAPIKSRRKLRGPIPHRKPVAPFLGTVRPAFVHGTEQRVCPDSSGWNRGLQKREGRALGGSRGVTCHENSYGSCLRRSKARFAGGEQAVPTNLYALRKRDTDFAGLILPVMLFDSPV